MLSEIPRDATPRRLGAVALAGLLVASAVAPAAVGAVAASENPEFTNVIYVADRNETVGISISVPEGTDAVRFTFGTDDANVTAHAWVADADGNGTVVLRVDTARAGNGNASSYLSVSEGDTLRNASQPTPAVDPPLDAADYAMSLGSPDGPVDKATLVVEGPSDGPPVPVNNTTTSETHTATDDGGTTTGLNGTTLVYEGQRVSLAPKSGETVRGETALDAGTELTVQLRATGASPFLETAEVAVSRYGTFVASVDLSNAEPGTDFEVVVRSDGRDLVTESGRVVDCRDDCAPTTQRDREATADLPADEIAIASPVEVTQTYAVEIPMTFGDADVVTVVVGGDSVNYRVSGVVRDYDGDARAIVKFDTRAAGFDAWELGLYDAGRWQKVQNYSETSLSGLLAPADYPVRVYRGTNTTGEPAAEGTLVLHDAPRANVDPTTTTAAPFTSTSTSNGTDVTTRDRGLLGSSNLLGVGAIAVGGVLAVLGAGVVLGVFRE